MKQGLRTSAVITLLAVCGCGSEPDWKKPGAPPRKDGQPHAVRVQHILIGFNDALGFKGREMPPRAATRTWDEANKLAAQAVERARKGEDFDQMVSALTDDEAPGLYGLINFSEDRCKGWFERSTMVEAFGDVAFGLKVGEIGLAEYSRTKSPFGWHIIKRLE